MTNRTAFWIGLLVIGALALDAVLFGWTYSLFLARKFSDLLWWLAFWR